ncbi:MAG TPA: LCP family protein [Chloroflexi bacterium]|nr:LCP family protein [Chloroflexota bacterium]
MQYTTSNERKRTFPFGLIMLLLGIAFVAMAGISINKIRNGQPGFLTNLWKTETVSEPDPFLDNNPITLDVSGKIKTIVLLGSDFQPEIGYRTDVILLVAMNTETNQFHLFSFPRDLWVNIPGVGEQRINTAYPFGGVETLSDTFALNFGFRPDHMAIVDFEGFKHLIDVLDGIDVEVGQRMEDECWLNDSGWCVVEEGTVPMSSNDALWYVRARKNSSDFDRNRRAQEVIQAMIAKALRPSELSNLPNVIKAGMSTIETEMKPADGLLYFLPLSKFLGGPDITTFRITPQEAVPGTTSGGASVLYPNIPAIQEILKQALWVE